MKVTITVDQGAIKALGANLGRKVQRSTAIALTKTAWQTKADVVEQMKSKIDRPTTFTLNSLVVRPAKYDRGSMTAKVEAKDWQEKYLRNIVSGVGESKRHLKRFELALQAVNQMPRGWVAVPAKEFALDAYGGMGRGILMKIISQIGTELLSGYQNKSTDAKVKARNQKRNGTFFAMQPGNREGLPPGVYQRRRFGSGWGSRMVLAYVKQARYKPQIDLEKIAEKAVSEHFQTEFIKALQS
ncbi:hypothetical protein HQN60_12570 [Deefgea piscis]|uniref:Phage protein n=1 Tax=Deefgea piscis TaxID=2739061 RepID=A0A6M8SS11_9NEIS|nr:hypothetical protein [Deefgea piscis]QKJ67471.1 hypothetical protein HQN60_12570 [Deefgea piscis]